MANLLWNADDDAGKTTSGGISIRSSSSSSISSDLHMRMCLRVLGVAQQQRKLQQRRFRVNGLRALGLWEGLGVYLADAGTTAVSIELAGFSFQVCGLRLVV